MKLAAPLFFICVLLAGCASAGTKVDPSAAAKIQKGITTKVEVIALLGQPMTDTLDSNGKEMMFWSYAQTQIKGTTFIPVVGLFSGGSSTNMTSFQVILDSNKIVVDDLWSNSNIDSKMGK
jgi:outer membrane protein assembly factor BamE (lipoprotein component of BamABCDE complex)